MPDAISAITPNAIDPNAVPAREVSFGDSLDTDMFLQLLVAQLKYQDPTAPADSSEFLAQTAQFTMVEKLTAIADHAEASAITNRNLGAASLVGRSIDWLADDGTTKSGVVTAARLGSAGPVLSVNGQDVPFDVVSAVSSGAAANRPSSPPATTT